MMETFSAAPIVSATTMPSPFATPLILPNGESAINLLLASVTLWLPKPTVPAGQCLQDFGRHLELRDSRVYDTIEEDGKEKRVLNQNETTLAQQKQQAIKDAFAGWVWKDPQRRTLLVKKVQ